MNDALWKNARSGSHDSELMRTLGQVKPSSDDIAWNVSMSWLFGSRRQSNQITQKLPPESTAIQGKNWSFRAGVTPSSLVDTVFVAPQVNPPSCDRLTATSPPEVALST